MEGDSQAAGERLIGRGIIFFIQTYFHIQLTQLFRISLSALFHLSICEEHIHIFEKYSLQ